MRAAGAMCRVMRSAGLQGTNAAHPKLLALIDSGTTEAEFAQAARLAVERGKGFAYALGALVGQRADAAAIPRKAEALHDHNRNVAAQWLQGAEHVAD